MVTSPFAERLRLARTFESALVARDKVGIEDGFRLLLAHRVYFVLPATEDIPLLLALLTRFEAKSTPSPALMRLVLYDGLDDGHGGRLEGLQRTLLRQRDRFTRPDWLFFVETLASLAERAGVPADDFRARASEVAGSPPNVPSNAAGAFLVGKRWLVSASGESAWGTVIDLEDLRQDLTREMVARGLTTPEHDLTLAFPPGELGPIDQIRTRFESRRWNETQRQLERNLCLKTGLAVAAGVLAYLVASLALAFHARRQRYLDLKAGFVAAVSHDLRTPLSAIRLLAETLERRTLDVPAAKDYPARIVRAADALSAFVEDVLSFERLERGRIVPRLATVRLGELVEFLRTEATAVIDANEPREQGGPAAVEIDAPDAGDSTLRADPQLLRLLLANLVRNSCLYNSKPVKRVRISTERFGKLLRFRDNGDGIPRSHWKRVFEEFWRGPEPVSTHRRAGAGLGHLPPDHEGAWRLHPRDGLFTGRHDLRAEVSVTEPRILLVEDDETLRIALEDNLREEGYDVASAATGREAARLAHEQAFDLAILDIMLPDTDGYSLSEALRNAGATRAVLMLTARTLEEDLLRGFAAGADDYLGKPFRLRELLVRVRALLRRGNSAGTAEPLLFAGLRLDPRARTLLDSQGVPVGLTKTEFDLLACLVRRKGHVLTRDEILDAVWGVDVHVDSRTVDNFVLSLRRKLGGAAMSPFQIATVRGVGYRLTEGHKT